MTETEMVAGAADHGLGYSDIAAVAKGEDPVLAGLRHPPVDPATSAVVVIDMVNHQLVREGMLGMLERAGLPWTYLKERVDDLVVPNHQRLLSAARRSGAAVVYLRLGCHRTDFGDAHPSLMPMLHEWGAREGTWACEVIDPIKPEDGDISLIKTGSGGFATSTLDSHLRNLGVEHVFYTGVVTNCCVMLTVAAGFDLGYHNYLVTDATATQTQHLQDSAEELIGLFMAENVTTDQCIERLDGLAEGQNFDS